MNCECPYCGSEMEQDMPDAVLLEEDRTLVWPGGMMRLTEAETVVMRKLFAAHPNNVTTERIADAIGLELHDDYCVSDKTVHVTICKLRKKFKAAGAPINIPYSPGHGAGYCLDSTSVQIRGKRTESDHYDVHLKSIAERAEDLASIAAKAAAKLRSAA